MKYTPRYVFVLLGLMLAIAIALGMFAAALFVQEEQKRTEIKNDRDLQLAHLLVEGHFSIEECGELPLDVDTKVIKDNTTGIRYLLAEGKTGTGLTVLVDQDGKPLIPEDDKDN